MTGLRCGGGIRRPTPTHGAKEGTHHGGQLATFRAIDQDAAWRDRVEIHLEGSYLRTRLGSAMEGGGPLTPLLRILVETVATAGGLDVELIPLVPCLHKNEHEHFRLTTPDGERRNPNYDLSRNGTNVKLDKVMSVT